MGQGSFASLAPDQKGDNKMRNVKEILKIDRIATKLLDIAYGLDALVVDVIKKEGLL